MSDTLSWHGGTIESFVRESDEAEQHQPPQLSETPQRGSEPVLLVTAGFAGAGKTTLAERLHAELGREVFNKDVLQYENLVKGEEKEKAGWLAFDRLFELVEEALLRGESVIVDTSNEKPFIFENIRNMLSKMEQQHIYPRLMILFCLADQETRRVRVHQRGSVFYPYVKDIPPVLDDAELGPRLGHLLPLDLRDLLEMPDLFKRYPSPLRKEYALFIDTNQPLETYIEAILQEVQNVSLVRL